MEHLYDSGSRFAVVIVGEVGVTVRAETWVGGSESGFEEHSVVLCAAKVAQEPVQVVFVLFGGLVHY